MSFSGVRRRAACTLPARHEHCHTHGQASRDYNTDLPATAASHLPSGVGAGEQSVSISSIRRRAVCTSPERTKNSQHLQPSRAPGHAHCMWVAMSGVKRITPASCQALSTGNYKPQGQRSALDLSVSGSSKIVRLHCNV